MPSTPPRRGGLDRPRCRAGVAQPRRIAVARGEYPLRIASAARQTRRPAAAPTAENALGRRERARSSSPVSAPGSVEQALNKGRDHLNQNRVFWAGLRKQDSYENTGPTCFRPNFRSGFSKSSRARERAATTTPDGQPDLQGIWTNATLTPLERPARMARQGVSHREGGGRARDSGSRRQRARRRGHSWRPRRHRQLQPVLVRLGHQRSCRPGRPHWWSIRPMGGCRSGRRSRSTARRRR